MSNQNIRFLPSADADHEGTHIALTTGHACRIYETDPQDGKRGTIIPVMFHKHAIAAGCGVVGIADDDSQDQQQDDTKQGLIVAAIENVIEQGGQDDLTGNGRPKVESVKRAAGFGITKEELDAAWAVFEQSLADDSDD